MASTAIFTTPTPGPAGIGAGAVQGRLAAQGARAVSPFVRRSF
jgi:hypothetical protein